MQHKYFTQYNQQLKRTRILYHFQVNWDPRSDLWIHDALEIWIHHSFPRTTTLNKVFKHFENVYNLYLEKLSVYLFLKLLSTLYTILWLKLFSVFVLRAYNIISMHDIRLEKRDSRTRKDSFRYILTAI